MTRYMQFLCMPLMAIMAGCTPSLPPSTPGGGFSLQTWLFTSVYSVVGNVGILAEFVSDFDHTSAGDPSTIHVTTGPNGEADLPGKRAPATWKFYWVIGGDPGCPTAFNNGINQTVGLHSLETIVCYVPTGQGGVNEAMATISPSTIYTAAPPTSVTISASGFSSQYGMPVVQYYDVTGTLAAQATATFVASDGSYISSPTPNLSQTVTGTYTGIAQNVTSTGQLAAVGGGVVNVVAPPGYMVVTMSTDSCGPVFYNWTYTDALGEMSVNPIVLSNGVAHDCQDHNPPGATYTDQYGHTIRISAAPAVSAQLLVSGSYQTIPMQGVN